MQESLENKFIPSGAEKLIKNLSDSIDFDLEIFVEEIKFYYRYVTYIELWENFFEWSLIIYYG